MIRWSTSSSPACAVDSISLSNGRFLRREMRGAPHTASAIRGDSDMRKGVRDMVRMLADRKSW